MDKLSIQSRDFHKSPHSRTKFTLPVWLVLSTPTGKTTDSSVVKFFFPATNTTFGSNVDGKGKEIITLKDAFVQL